MLVNKVIEDAGGATNMPVSKKYRGICTCSSVNFTYTYMYIYTVNAVVIISIARRQKLTIITLHVTI